MADSRIGVGFGGDGGAGGLTLGPPTNSFSGANRAGAETARDNYGSANSSWLAQYDANPTYTILISWPLTPTNTVYQARRNGSWADVTGLLRGPRGEQGLEGPQGEPPGGNTSAYSYLVKPTLTDPNVTTDQTIARTGDGYIHTLVSEFAGPAGITPGADFITEWEGSVSVEVANTCNLEFILRTKHAFGTPEKTLVHERVLFHDLVADARQTFSMTEFYSRSTPVAGTYKGVTVTRDEIQGESKITYELEIRTFARRSESNRISNTLMTFTGMGIETTSFQLQQAVENDEGLLVDAVLFWSPTAQHVLADAVRYGDTVTIDYGGTQVEADVYNVSRDGHIITMILAPLEPATWTAIEGVANATVSDSDGNQFGSWVTASRVIDRDNVNSAGQWFRAISEAGAGAEVWREIDRIDEVDNTHLTVGTRTGTTLELRSSTGDDVLLPSATASEAGIESAADKELLEALPPKWTVGAYGIGTERSWAQKIYRCIVARTVANTDNPAADTTGWALGVSSSHRGTTNLSVGNRTASSLDVESDTGTNATLPSASQTEAGLQSAADKTKLDGVAAGAQANVQADWNESQSTAGSYIDNKPTIPDVSDFRTQAQIAAEITAALAGDGKVIDGGEWDATDAYAAKTLVYTTGSGAASYLSKIAVAANTQSTTEPGVGSDWRTSWVRTGYQDGPPNAFIDAGLTGRHLNFTREGGTNPQTLEIPIGTGQLVPEVVGTAGYTIATANVWVAEDAGDQPVDVSDIADTDILALRGEGADNDADLALFLGSDIQRNAMAGGTPGGRQIKVEVFGTARGLQLGADSDGHLLVADSNANADIATLTLWRLGGNNAPTGSTRVERITFQAQASGGGAFEAQPLAANPLSVVFGDGSNQIITNVDTNDFDLAAGVHQFFANIPLPDGNSRNFHAYVTVRDASDDSVITRFASTKGNNENTAGTYLTADGILYLSQATTVNFQIDRVDGAFAVEANWYIELARWGGGVTGFNPGRIGTATFDLNGSATNVALMDDTASAPIVCPAEGWVIAVITVPGLGLNGSVTWMLAEDLRAADADSTLTASLYTNAQNQVFFGAGDQDGGATMGNKVILHHTGTITESSGGASAIVLPTILEFDVTGDSQVTGADISNKAYSWETRISQSAHVGSARIVGFMGTEANPSNVDNLDTITDYFHETGSFNLPANRTLASVGSIYTIREEVYPTGVADTTAPTIYHDFRVERVAPASHVHFGSIPFRRGDGTTPTDASDVIGFTLTDMSTAASAAGDWTITGLTEGRGEQRLYWAVPVTLAQPVNWLNAGDNVNDIIDTPSAAQTISGVSYRVYVTNTQFDDLANGTTYTTRTS